MSKNKKSKKNPASLDKYGSSIATVLAVGVTVWAFFRVGYKIKGGVSGMKKKRSSRKES